MRRRNPEPLCSFGGLLTLRTIAILRSHRIALNRIAALHDSLRKAMRIVYPFATRTIQSDVTAMPASARRLIDAQRPGSARLTQLLEVLRNTQRADTTRMAFSESDTGHALWWEVADGVGIDPTFFGGTPCVFGTRVPAVTIGLWYTRDGMSAQEIADDFDVTVPEVMACVAWHRRVEAVSNLAS